MQKIWLAAALLLLGSCTLSMSREEVVENLLPTPTLEQSISESLDEIYFVQDGWPSQNWWEMYGSQELNDLIALALKQNPTIQAVQAKLDYAKQNAIIVGSKLYPLITFDTVDQLAYLSKNGLYRALNPKLPLANQQIDLGLSFFYEFDFWGQYRNLYNAALGFEKAALAETAQAELITEASLSISYFALLTNLVRKSLYEKLYEVRKKYYDLQVVLERNALLSALPPLLSEEDVFQAEQWVLGIEEEIAANQHIVNILAGRGPDEPIAVAKSLPTLPKQLAIPQEISMDLLSRRPDLMAQIWRTDALAKEVGSAKAGFWPNINLSMFAGWESGSWSKLFQWASKMLNAIPGLSLPVYTAGEIQANIDAKRALFNEAIFQYNELVLKSFQEVADLLALGRSIYGQKEQQDKIVVNAGERYRLTLLLQEKGIDSAFPVYSTLEELLKKQLDDVQLLYSQYLVSVKLIQALGGGYLAEECNASE